MVEIIMNDAPTNFGKGGLLEGHYYWCRHDDGSHFIAKLNGGNWWVIGLAYAVELTRDQIILHIKPPVN